MRRSRATRGARSSRTRNPAGRSVAITRGASASPRSSDRNCSAANSVRSRQGSVRGLAGPVRTHFTIAVWPAPAPPSCNRATAQGSRRSQRSTATGAWQRSVRRACTAAGRWFAPETAISENIALAALTAHPRLAARWRHSKTTCHPPALPKLIGGKRKVGGSTPPQTTKLGQASGTAGSDPVSRHQSR